LNIVFDLGGVVVTWKPEIIIAKVFADPAVQSKVRSEIVGHADWLALDRGTLLLQEAIVRASERTGLSVPDVAKFMRQVPPSLVAIPDTVELLYRLKANGHKLFCLSNMHITAIEYLEKVYTFWRVFEDTVISCRIHLIKPEPAIYAHLLEKHRLYGTKTVFIDDVKVNLQAAERFGIHTIQFDNPAQCESQLMMLGCI
jgi:putative hydrolase of the HAD superfamily